MTMASEVNARVERMEQLVTALAIGAGHDLDDLRADGVIS